MSYQFLSEHSAKIFSLIKKEHKVSAGNLITVYFKNNHTLGSRDRKIIFHIVFFWLRNKELVNYIHKKLILKDLTIDKEILAMFISVYKWKNMPFYSLANNSIYMPDKLLKSFEINSDKIKKEHLKLELCLGQVFLKIQSDLEQVLNKPDTFDNSWLNFIGKIYSIPYFFLRQIINNNLTNRQLLLLLQSLTIPAPLSLRINTNLFEMSKIIDDLKECTIFSKGRLSPCAIIGSQKVNITQTEIYKNGQIEIQDESSQMLAYSIEPEDDSKILDACAGAGGKTLHLASLYPKCTIWASDKNARKLKELSKRAKRSDLKNIIIVEDVEQLLSKKLFFDYLIIDSPCSGSGTVRRSPELKYKMNKFSLKNYNSLQKKIIRLYSPLLKEGGELIYSTCSLFKSENECISDWVIENLNYSALALPEIFNEIEQYGANTKSNSVVIFPFQFSSDGFFISRHKKLNIK